MQIKPQIDSIKKTSPVLERKIYERYIKRITDIFFSIVGLIILLPIVLSVAVLVKIKLGSPIIYKTKRAGMDEKPFTLYKFRSMLNTKDKNGEQLPDVMRLTKFGQALRSTSLDELPELINIIKGDMSIIGPRPLPLLYLPYYSDIEKLRHNVRPGLTGLAQVNGRNSLTWEDKFAYDIKYINNITLIGDLKIILKTIIKVFKRSDIGQAGIDSPGSFHLHRIRQMEEETYRSGVN